MKQNAFFFGVAYSLSIGSVLLLGGRKEDFSKVSTPSIAAASEPATTTALIFAPDHKPEFPVQSRSRIAMAPKRHSLDVLSDATETKTDDLPPALKQGQLLPKTHLDAVDITIAQSNPFRVDEEPVAFESTSKPVPVPVEGSDDELNSLAPAEPLVEDAAKLAELRETMVTLTKAKAELLNAKALEDEITQLHKQIANLQAARRLLDAHQVLEKLIQEFPESPAANRAKSMLNALPTSRTSKDHLTPIPDPKFLGPKGA